MSEYELLFDHKQKPQTKALDLPLCTEGLKEGIPGRTSKPPSPYGWLVLSVTLPGSSCRDFICMWQPCNPASLSHGCCVISNDGETSNRNNQIVSWKWMNRSSTEGWRHLSLGKYMIYIHGHWFHHFVWLRPPFPSKILKGFLFCFAFFLIFVVWIIKICELMPSNQTCFKITALFSL